MTRLEHIQAILEKNNQPKFRLEQIKTAIYRQSFTRYSQISNIPKEIKEQIISVLGDQILTQNKVHHTMRQDFGTDIQAACGQLAANYAHR